MLDPYNRLNLVNELRPSPGFEFDAGIGTTFSLDLESLLTVPLSLVLCEFESRDDALSKPEAVLEGLRRMAGKLNVFCHRGRIKRPKGQMAQFSFLEDMVAEVLPEDPHVSFHPKVWVLRYRRGEDTMLRVLVLSRNLTFDKSWDTALVLDGMLQPDRRSAVQRNGRLAQFIRALPALSGPARERVTAAIESLAEDVLRTEFDAPDGIDEFEFWPLGIGTAMPRHLFKGPHGRFMVISPFLSDLTESRSPGALDLLLERRTKVAQNVLISRPDQLDALSPDSVTALAETTDIFVLDDAAAHAEQASEQPEEEIAERGLGVLSGLHAKVYVVENGREVSIYTGSANATSAGWGRGATTGNVEFVVELHGERTVVGIDKLLGDEAAGENGGRSLRKLLKPYHAPEQQVEPDADAEKVGRLLDEARRAVSAAAISVDIAPSGEGDEYSVVLNVPPDASGGGVDVWVWPIMVSSGFMQQLPAQKTPTKLEFGPRSMGALTPFWAFRVKAKVGKAQQAEEFVLRLPVTGMPEGRTAALLAQMISSSDRFLRYLGYLLSDDASIPGIEEPDGEGGSKGTGGDRAGAQSVILFEDLVRAYSRSPERLDRIEALIADLKKGGAGPKVIPPGFAELWQAFRPSKT